MTKIDLNEYFGHGWVNKFNARVNNLYIYFPDIKLDIVTRYLGMLRIRFLSDNPDIQSIINDVTYKIERESTKICEQCGNYGRRQDPEIIPEKMCLCWKCFALKTDEILQSNLNSE